MSNKEKQKNLLSNDHGVALLMVMSIVAILTVILADFTFETKLNKISIYNQQDRAQAKLNAEAGLNFSMAKLKIYQYARNMLEKNDSIPITPDKIEALITMPFAYPIPVPKDTGPIGESAAQEFIDNTLLKGEMTVTISPVRGFLNPNNLRISTSNSRSDDDPVEETDPESPQAYLEKEFVSALKNTIENERENNEDFDIIHPDIDPEQLIKELKFFVNDKEALPYEERSEPERIYLEKNLVPKHAPLTSISELYLLAGWDDDIVDLMKDKMTVHEVSFISINEITDEQLRLFFPDITDEQLEEFFRYRDGHQATSDEDIDEDPHPFKNVDEFKSVIVNRLAIVSDEAYDTRIEEFKTAGLQLGVAGKLFKVESTGKYNRASYTLIAYVDLPVKPSPTPTPKPGTDPDPDPDTTPTPTPTAASGEPKEEKLELLDPRVVEIIVN